MSGMEIFAVLFLAWILIGLPLVATWELGGKDIIADKLVKFIDSRTNKKKSI